jgi:hypothetical protein
MTSRLSAAALLSRQGRPPGDVSTVLEARDPRIIRRHLELHRGRLVEQAIDQRRAVIGWNSCSSRRSNGH